MEVGLRRRPEGIGGTEELMLSADMGRGGAAELVAGALGGEVEGREIGAGADGELATALARLVERAGVCGEEGEEVVL